MVAIVEGDKAVVGKELGVALLAVGNRDVVPLAEIAVRLRVGQERMRRGKDRSGREGKREGGKEGGREGGRQGGRQGRRRPAGRRAGRQGDSTLRTRVPSGADLASKVPVAWLGMSAAGTSVCTVEEFSPVIFRMTASVNLRPQVRDMIMLHAQAQRA